MSKAFCTKTECKAACEECSEKTIAIKSAFNLLDTLLRNMETDELENLPILSSEVEQTLNELSSAFMELELFRATSGIEIDESMDGDFDSAMASAGMGTGEDYHEFDERC